MANGVVQSKPPAIRGKTAPPYVEKDTMLNERYRVEAMIGGGGFGQIYRAVDTVTRKRLAVKVEPITRESGRMILERMVLETVKSEHVPVLYAAGSIEEYNYLAMELLGRNLTEIRRRQKLRRLEVPAIARIGADMVAAIRAVHDIGYLHRDIKPSNMCVGENERRNTVILLDFGMARKYRNNDGSIRRQRVFAAFRGTMRYVSLNVHQRKEQTAGDDLVSLFYSLAELGEGALPWRTFADNDAIEHAKMIVDLNELLAHVPKQLQCIYHHALHCGNNPNYTYISDVLSPFLPSSREELDTASAPPSHSLSVT